jgi:hypothetical protein
MRILTRLEASCGLKKTGLECIWRGLYVQRNEAYLAETERT